MSGGGPVIAKVHPAFKGAAHIIRKTEIGKDLLTGAGPHIFYRLAELVFSGDMSAAAQFCPYRFRIAEEIRHQVQQMRSQSHQVLAAAPVIALSVGGDGQGLADLSRVQRVFDRLKLGTISAGMRHTHGDPAFFHDPHGFIRFLQIGGKGLFGEHIAAEGRRQTQLGQVGKWLAGGDHGNIRLFFFQHFRRIKIAFVCVQAPLDFRFIHIRIGVGKGADFHPGQSGKGGVQPMQAQSGLGSIEKNSNFFHIGSPVSGFLLYEKTYSVKARKQPDFMKKQKKIVKICTCFQKIA